MNTTYIYTEAFKVVPLLNGQPVQICKIEKVRGIFVCNHGIKAEFSRKDTILILHLLLELILSRKIWNILAFIDRHHIAEAPNL